MSNIKGKVSTDIVGSTVTFDLGYEEEEWNEMTEEKQEKELIRSMWESGMVDVRWEKENE